MVKRENREVHLTGRDEVIFSIVLFMLNLCLDERDSTRMDVNIAIYYFRDLGLPVKQWLFDHLLGRWDTRLAWGTTARTVSFPMDGRDPAGGLNVIYRARRRQLWMLMCEAVGCPTAVSAPPWVRNTPELGGDLPAGDAMLTAMADVLGTELLDRLTEWTEPQPDPIPASDPAQNGKAHSGIEAIFDKLKEDPEIEVGFRHRRWLNLDLL